MPFDINSFANFSPVVFGLTIALIYWGVRQYRQATHGLEDVFVVGFTGGALPAGFVLIYAAVFDLGMVSKLSSAPVYVGLAGIAVLYISLRTIVDKITSK